MAEPSHQRDERLAGTVRQPTPNRLAALVRVVPRRIRVAAPIAVAATLGVVGVGTVLVEADGTPDTDPTRVEALVDERDSDSSRAAERTAAVDAEWETWQAGLNDLATQQASQAAAAQAEAEATAAAVAAADTSLWATTDLNLYATATSEEVLDLLASGTEVLVTGRNAHGRDEVVIDGSSRWVSEGYLSEEEPTAEADTGSDDSSSGGSSGGGGGTCTTSSAPSGVVANIAAIHEVVCANWPSITDFGGTRTDGDHGRGLALDVMVRGATGWEIAEYLRANYSQYDINYIIFEQQIWSVERSSEGWRPMENRGSDTANHYDHVHISVYS